MHWKGSNVWRELFLIAYWNLKGAPMASWFCPYTLITFQGLTFCTIIVGNRISTYEFKRTRSTKITVLYKFKIYVSSRDLCVSSWWCQPAASFSIYCWKYLSFRQFLVNNLSSLLMFDNSNSLRFSWQICCCMTLVSTEMCYEKWFNKSCPLCD